MDESTFKKDGFTRREFLGLTGGLVVLFSLPGPMKRAVAQEEAAEGDIDAWLHIGLDNHVTVFSGKVDMGQGTTTAFTQLAAEELTLPLENITMVMGETDRVPFDWGTWGSDSMRDVGVRIREAAAGAREILTEMAAEQWGVSPEAVTVKDGRVLLTADPYRSMALGEVTKGQRIERKLQGEAKLLPKAQHRLVGKPTVQLMSRAIVTGAQKYVADLRTANLLYGAEYHPPCFKAKVKNVDTKAAEQVPGVVKVVVEGDFIGVAGTSPEAVTQGIARLQVTCEEPEHPVMAALWDDFRRKPGKADIASEEGKVMEALARATQIFSTTYRAPYVAHAPIETHASLVEMKGDQITAYVAAQTPFIHRDELSGALGVPKKNVHVFVPRVGGGFGGKTNAETAIAAARLSRATGGRPVLVAHTRPEEFTWNYFKPAALIDIKSVVDETGQIIAWESDIYNCGDRGAVPVYDLPHHRVRCWECETHLAQGAWRGLAGLYTTFAIESHMDEVARTTKQDPVAFRLRHLKKEPRMARTVEAAAKAFGWTPQTERTGRGVGFACAPDAGSYAAEAAEIEVGGDGVIRVKRAVIAHENGITINPDGLINQMEGGFIMGMGPTLWEEIRYDKGRILTNSFTDYRIPTIQDIPVFTSVLVPSDSMSPGGAGEPALFPVAALIANALYDATGKRIRELPLTPARVKG